MSANLTNKVTKKKKVKSNQKMNESKQTKIVQKVSKYLAFAVKL